MNLDLFVAPRIRARDIICRCDDPACTHKRYDPLEHPRTRELIKRTGALLSRGDYNFSISSGFRCPAHNAAVGGSANSAHVHRCALDIKFHDPAMSLDFALRCEAANWFSGILVYVHWNMLHVDVHPNDRVVRGHSFGKAAQHFLGMGDRFGSPLYDLYAWNLDEKMEMPAYVAAAMEREEVDA